MKLRIYNPDIAADERTYLASDYTTGTTLTVKNCEGFTTDWFLVIGEPGHEQTEIKRVSSTSGSTAIIIPDALSFSHNSGTPVYLTRWNQLSIERGSSATGSFSEISGSPVSIEWDDSNLSTVVVDDSGSTAHYYRWRFKNSVSGVYSSYSDVLAGTGVSRDTVGYVIEQVKKSPLSKSVDEDTIISYCNDFEDVVYEAIPQAWWWIKEGDPVSTTESTYSYAINSNWADFVSARIILYRYINGSSDRTYPLRFIPLIDFYNLKSDSTQTDDDNVIKWTLLPPDSTNSKGYIGVHPTPKTDDCYIKPVYTFSPTPHNSYGDKLTVPSVRGYIDYVLYRISDDIKQDKDNSDKYNTRYLVAISYLKVRARKQRGQFEMFRFRGTRGYSSMYGGEATREPDSETYW